MYAKQLLLSLLMLMGVSVKAQLLLNANPSEIRKQVKSRGVGLTTIFSEKDNKVKGHLTKMNFRFAMPQEGNSCLMETTFFLTSKNKCFKYDEKYWGDDIAYHRIKMLMASFNGLTKLPGVLRWADTQDRFEITLIPEKIGDNNFASVYVLEIKSIKTN